MPLVAPSSSNQVFWNTTDILNFARALVNDAQGSIAGQDLADTTPYTWPLLNLCFAKLANWLEDSNVESATYKEAIVSLPVNAPPPDPNAQSALSYDGFYDAQGFRNELPTLPPDLVEPLEVWGRITGQNAAFYRIPQQLGGLSAAYIGAQSYARWEFRQMSLYLSGGTYAPSDLRIRYIPSFPVLVQPTNGDPAPIIPFARAGEALAYLVAAEYLEIRNAATAPMMRCKANEQLQIIANKSSKRSNQAQQRRKGYGFGGRRGGTGAFRVYG
jgi:hypothetical protein